MQAREKSRVDMIYEVVRERICLGTYQSGDVLHEAELGGEFEVSRTPIRQVLQRLAYEKLATVRSGVGTIVGGLGATDAHKCLQIRRRVLAIVADLDITTGPPDSADSFDALLFRASRLEDRLKPDQVWTLARDLHLFCNGLIDDDLLRHVDEMLFYRTAPALVDGIRRETRRAVEAIVAELKDLERPMAAGDLAAFFTARADRVLSYRELLLASAD